MRKFRSFLTEKAMISTGKTGERHVKQYLHPFLNKKEKDTHTLATGHEDLKPGTKLTIHGHETKGGRQHAIASQGGKGKRYHIPIHQIHKPDSMVKNKNPFKAEEEHHKFLNKQIEAAKKKHGTSHITVYPGHSTEGHKVGHVEKVQGTPKADFVLKDHEGKPVHWMSHKAGATPKDFQQYGGVSKHEDHPVVKHFAKQVRKKFPKGVSGQTVAMHLDMKKPEHRDLAHKMVYGDHSTGGHEHGPNNVHALYQGHMHLTPHENGKKGHYRLTATNVHHHGEIPGHPMIYARGGGDRANAGLPGTRIGVGDKTARKVTTEVK